MLLRYLHSDPVGLAGKVSQLMHNSPGQCPAAAQCSVPREVRDAIDTLDETPAYAGTVAHVFRGTHNGQAVCLKVVPPSVRRILHGDHAAMHGGCVGQLFSTGMGEFVHVLAESLLREGCMATEREMAQHVADALRGAAYADMRVAVANIVPALCTNHCFAYEFIDAAHPVAPIPPALANRMVTVFFRLALLNGVLMADTNPGNFLYSAASDELFLLDFGNTHRMTDAQRDVFRRLHNGGVAAGQVGAALGESVPTECAAVVAKMLACFYDDDVALDKNGTIAQDLLALDGCVAQELRADMAIAFRAIVSLACSLNHLGVQRLTTAQALRDIIPATKKQRDAASVCDGG